MNNINIRENNNINHIKPFIFTKKLVLKQTPKLVSRWTPKINKSNKNNILLLIKHFPSATKEWYNSIYTFNKNNLKNLSVANNNLSNIIKNYFNFHFNNKIFRCTSKKLSTRYRRLNIKTIFVGKAEVKHTTNQKIIITMYVYNEEKRILMSKIRRLERLLFSSQSQTGFNISPLDYTPQKNKYLSFYNKLNIINYTNNNTILKKNLKSIMLLILKQIKTHQLIFSRGSLVYNTSQKNNIEFLARELFIISQLKIYYKEIVNIINICKNNTAYYEYYEKYFYEAKYKIILEKEIKRIVYYKQLLSLNKSKFEDNYLSRLKPLISKIWRSSKKDIEFNIINLKNISLDSNIFTKAISLKIKNRKNKLLKVLRRSLDTIVLAPSKTRKIVNNYYTPNNIENNNKTLLNTIYNTIKYKKIAGARLEAKGRLTRRLTASRSVFKIKWKGSLKNLDSSYKRLSSVMLRGNIRSNIQYSIINSKTRNGAFGIKGWISGK
jgi:Mitochondrial ribosomal protein (VAR1)